MNNKKFKLFTLLVIIILTMSLIVACGKNNTQSADKSGDNSTDIATIKTMTGEELVKQNSGKEKDKVLIIDVRSPEEYKAGHIQHAINMNIEGFEDSIGELEDLKDFPIITYCNSGKKSGQVAEILVNKGFKDVTNAAGVKEFEYDLVHYDDLRGATFQKLIDENKDMILVDVRPEKQVAQEGMIEGAINIPFDAVESNLDKLPKDKTIALYCNTGTKSAEVAKQLEDIGYENIVNAIEGVKEFPFVLVK
ncbi:rhodanese-related sulfurtransferase [Tissierella praeacuta]|uniref:rhodanese-like domain-containing protein n=1 Tax=Tissierella praeacuta TaxID=43131 RepID=UPI001043424D|nr:rhodanese-like domain-containing protein [Tissierella praeacuta]TCU71633.1 rhodanese-related sulfurtransferase [Tissierella praeacuta]